MMESVTGRSFLDLYKLETVLSGHPGISRAEAYVQYGEDNKLYLTADVYSGAELEAGGAEGLCRSALRKNTCTQPYRFQKTVKKQHKT